MPNNIFPTTYVLEIYKDLLINDASLHAESLTPFMNFSVGDLFDHHVYSAWQNPPTKKGEYFVIKTIRHIFIVGENDNNVHSVSLVMEKNIIPELPN